ncbi:ankyrin repeat-containing domain protein [Mycena galopus ATCC 62051]|nr:ankyrin repeat-containing domain protein [Mycena galopus ATCC 62051]
MYANPHILRSIFSAESRQAVLDQNIRSTLEKWLQPANVALSQRDAANKRHAETGLWLFQRVEFKEWIYASNSLMWLHGISGSGKTVLRYFTAFVSTIINALRARAEPLAFFYFDTNNRKQLTVTQLLYSLVDQLSVQAHPPDKTLNSLWTAYANGKHLPSNAALISDALIPILRQLTKPVYIVLDALDECSERDELLRVITLLVDAKLLHVHILMTSRPEIIATLLMSLPSSYDTLLVTLDSHPEKDNLEFVIGRLLNEEVRQESEFSSIPFPDTSALAARTFRDKFRLIALQLNQLCNCDGTDSEITEALSELPTSLNAIYDRILADLKPRMLSKVLHTMAWLMFSRCPMELKEVIDALAFNFNREPLRFNSAERMRPKALLDACAGFVTLSQDDAHDRYTLKLAHASVKEYFLSATSSSLPGDFDVSERTAHRLITRTCIAYLCSLDHPLEHKSDLQCYPLALYAANYWFYHIKLFDGPKQLVDEILELFGRDSPQYITWCRLYTFRQGIRLGSLNKSAVVLPPIYAGVFVGILQVVERLLDQGADVNEQGGEYGSALQAACAEGHTQIACLLVERRANMNMKGGRYDNALQAASTEGHTEIVRQLVEHGVDLNMQGNDINAVQIACVRGHTEIVRLLVKHGAAVNGKQDYHGSALQAAAGGGYTEIVRLLVEHNADVNAKGGRYGGALQAASYYGHCEIARHLLEHGADVNAEDGDHPDYGSALLAACTTGKLEIVRILLEYGADMYAERRYHGNALQAASYNGHAAIVRLLLQHGADVNPQGIEWGTALVAACIVGNTQIAQLLLEHGADVNAKSRYDGRPLQAASCRGHTEILRLLIEYGVDANEPVGPEGTLLKYAASRRDTEFVRFLLAHGAEVNVQDRSYHGNAIHAASCGGEIDIVRLLLECGADVNARGGYYGNALQAAASRGQIEIVRLLLEHGADANMEGGTYSNALYGACSEGRTEIVSLLLQHGVDVHAVTKSGGNALQAASFIGHTEIVQILIKDGADVNQQSEGYGNALQAASFQGNIEIVSVLIKHGADVNAQQGIHGTALQAAANQGHEEISSLLINHGADVNANGGMHGSALQAA